MEQRYASFLIRWWRPVDGAPRIKIEHIQSGDSTAVSTLAASLRWLETRLADADGAPAGTDGPAEGRATTEVTQ